jgi:hypothetical protein
MDCHTKVQDVIAARRQRFAKLYNVDELEYRLEQNKAVMDECSNRRDLRRRNALQRDSETLRREINRRNRKGQLFDVLANDVHEALQIATINSYTTPAASLSYRVIEDEAKPKSKADQFVDDANLLLEDVMLIDDGDRLQDARAQVDDICINCGTLMERNLQLSYLVCPNLECQHMRWYMDTSTFSNTAYTTRIDISKNAPKCVTHYSTFLNTCQGKTTKKFPRDYLMKICFYCYVEGARSCDDITKELINKAQKYLGVTEYNISTILKTQLRGSSLRLPPEVIKKLQLLFKALWPVFAQMKGDLDPKRANMINFNFVSRVLCRLLGYDIFLPLFDKFRMPYNEIKHSAFMRQMFHELGWVWQDRKLTDISDAVLDEYERRMNEFGDVDDEGELLMDE